MLKEAIGGPLLTNVKHIVNEVMNSMKKTPGFIRTKGIVSNAEKNGSDNSLEPKEIKFEAHRPENGFEKSTLI